MSEANCFKDPVHLIQRTLSWKKKERRRSWLLNSSDQANEILEPSGKLSQAWCLLSCAQDLWCPCEFPHTLGSRLNDVAYGPLRIYIWFATFSFSQVPVSVQEHFWMSKWILISWLNIWYFILKQSISYALTTMKKKQTNKGYMFVINWKVTVFLCKIG